MSSAQTLYVNADIVTLDPSMPRARCLLVDDKRIAQVLADQPAGQPRSTRIVDCAGAAMLPGFHDCHVHLTATGLLRGDRDLSRCNDIPAVLDRVKKLAAGQPLVYAGNFDEQLVAEKRLPKRAELDAACGGKPALVSRVDGHSCVANAAAFDFLKVDEAKPGVEKDSSGAPTGRLSGPVSYAAQYDFVRQLPTASRSARRRSAVGS